MAWTLYRVAYADGGATPSAAQIVAGTAPGGALDADDFTPPLSGPNNWPTLGVALGAGSYRTAMVGWDGTQYTAVSVSDAWEVAATFNPAWARRSGHIIGSGVR